MPRKRKGREIDEQIKKMLEEAPEFEGYTIKELATAINRPWPTTRWHLELLQARGEVKYREIGRAKLYSLVKKPKKEK